MKTGMSFKDAMQKNLMDPLQSKSNYGTYSKSMENKALGIDNSPYDLKEVGGKIVKFNSVT